MLPLLALPFCSTSSSTGWLNRLPGSDDQPTPIHSPNLIELRAATKADLYRALWMQGGTLAALILAAIVGADAAFLSGKG